MALPVLGFQDQVTNAVAHFKSDRPNKRTYMLLGEPGGGKTACAYKVAEMLGFQQDEIMLLRPSLHTPVDYMGVPSTKDGLTTWCPPDFIHAMTTGKIKFVILDELSDAVVSVQNVICGLIYDFEVAGIKIDPNICFMATGNRVQDRSGANRLVTKLTNRMSMHELAHCVDSWVEHAIDMNWPKDTVAFIHWQGERALYGESGFDPNEQVNSSPRQWEEVCYIDQNLPANLFLAQVMSLIPEGMATEYMAFRKTIADLPPISEIKAHPDSAPVSDKADVNYALTSRLITEVDAVKDYQHYMKYVTRMPMEMQTLFNNATYKRVDEIVKTPEYNKWCVANHKYFGRTTV